MNIEHYKQVLGVGLGNGVSVSVSGFFHLRSDILAVEDGSAAGSLAILKKQLHSLGMPSWEDVKDINRTRESLGHW